MSQYPPPSNQPPYQPQYFSPPPRSGDPLAPARRASVLMWVLGSLLVLGGVCLAAVSQVLIRQRLASTPQGPQLLQQFDQIEAQMGFTIQTLLFAMGTVVLVVGAIFGLLAFWVRRGGIAAAITSLLFVSLPLLFTGFVVIVGLVQVFRGSPEAIGAVLLYGVPLALLILLAVWLIQAAKNSAGVNAISQQANAQYWQSQQQGQHYQQPGAGGPPQTPAVPGHGYPGQGPGGQQYGPPPPQQGWYAPPPPPPPDGPAGGGYGYAQQPPPREKPPASGEDRE